MERKDLENSRELTGHEAANKWPGQPRMSRSQGHLLLYDFYRISNPTKYIFVLQNVRRMAVV